MINWIGRKAVRRDWPPAVGEAVAAPTTKVPGLAA